MRPLLPFVRLLRLRKTVEHIRLHGHARAGFIPDVPTEGFYPEHLQAIPICGPETFAADPWAFRCGGGLPDFFLTSGGSSGAPKLVIGSAQTVEARLAEHKRARVLPLIMRSAGSSQGFVPFVPGRVGGIAVPFLSEHNYVLAWELLNRVFAYDGYEQRISMLSLPLPALKQLVHFVLERGLDTSNLALRSITTYAWHTTAAWRELVERVLRAPLRSMYGFTEALGVSAYSCEECGHYHYADSAWWEVVHPVTHAPVEEGWGLLVVTTLVPYALDTLLLRYAPGDFVRLGPYCAKAHERGFRVLGRQRHVPTLRDGEDMWLLGAPTDVVEELDTHHWVARLDTPRHSGVTPTQDESFPKWNWSVESAEGQAVLRLQVELKGSPRLYRDAWLALATRLNAALHKANTDLARLEEAGRVRLKIVGLNPGSLPGREVILC